MSALVPALLLAAALDGEAALRHASALAALGPHPWGSPRAAPAAEYVAAQFREAGLDEVRLQDFASHGIRGANVIGVLRAPGPEFVVVGAHHDTAPGAPGAYDDGGGVGVLIEAARVLARERSRPRTLVFVSFDAEEAWSTGRTTTAGSRAYIDSLGPERRDLVAAFVIEMCGWKGGTPVFHPIAYADPLRPGGTVITPGWLLAAAQDGARESGASFGVGDPLIPWLYQPVVRTFRVSFYGDDLSFLQAGLPAVFVADSSFSAFYPWYHQGADTADKLDAAALARMGQAALGVVRALGQVRRGPESQPGWFAAFGRLLSGQTLLALGALSLLPGLVRAFTSGGFALGARFVQAALFVVLLWRDPVPALWVFLLPNVLTAVGRWWVTALSFIPLLALAVLGAVATLRGDVSGVWLGAWELAAAASALALLLVPRGASPSGRKPSRRR